MEYQVQLTLRPTFLAMLVPGTHTSFVLTSLIASSLMLWYRTFAAASLLIIPVCGRAIVTRKQPIEVAKRPSFAVRPGSPSRHELLARHKARTHYRPWLLPPVPHQQKLTVVLDLDETLVCAYRLKCMSPDLIAQHLQQPRDPHAAAHKLQVRCQIPPGAAEQLVVYLRPGVQAFLDKLRCFAEVVLFTAGVQGYAEPLVRAIDPDRSRFSAVLYRPATLQTRSRDYVKDLDSLGRDMSRLVLVDNNPLSFMLQPLNGIPVEPYAGDHTDTFLLDVLLPLLNGLAHLPDVRPVLDSKFGMVDWFKGRGLDVSSHVSHDMGGLKHHIPDEALAYRTGGSIVYHHH